MELSPETCNHENGGRGGAALLGQQVAQLLFGNRLVGRDHRVLEGS